jgi:hypothetical protein
MTILYRLLFPERIGIRVISVVQPPSPSHLPPQQSPGPHPSRGNGFIFPVSSMTLIHYNKHKVNLELSQRIGCQLNGKADSYPMGTNVIRYDQDRLQLHNNDEACHQKLSRIHKK